MEKPIEQVQLWVLDSYCRSLSDVEAQRLLVKTKVTRR